MLVAVTVIAAASISLGTPWIPPMATRMVEASTRVQWQSASRVSIRRSGPTGENRAGSPTDASTPTSAMTLWATDTTATVGMAMDIATTITTTCTPRMSAGYASVSQLEVIGFWCERALPVLEQRERPVLGDAAVLVAIPRVDVA